LVEQEEAKHASAGIAKPAAALHRQIGKTIRFIKQASDQHFGPFPSSMLLAYKSGQHAPTFSSASMEGGPGKHTTRDVYHGLFNQDHKVRQSARLSAS
jgi:hypothetical protein